MEEEDVADAGSAASMKAITLIATKTPDTYGCGEGYSLRFNHKGKWRTLSIGKFEGKFEIQDDLPNMNWDTLQPSFPNSVDFSKCQIFETNADNFKFQLLLRKKYTSLIFKLQNEPKCCEFRLKESNVSKS